MHPAPAAEAAAAVGVVVVGNEDEAAALAPVPRLVLERGEHGATPFDDDGRRADLDPDPRVPLVES